MATFSVDGYEIFSHFDRAVSDIKGAKLQIVSALGSASMDVSYATDDPNSAEVTLSDYNILLNGLHLNDGVLPERIELFNLKWSSNDTSEQSQVINFAFQDANGWRDYIFSVGQSALPNLTKPDAVTDLLSTAVFSVVDKGKMDDGFRLHLDDMPGVSVDGVIYKLFADEAAINEQRDHFQFHTNDDGENPDETEFDIAVRHQDTNPLVSEPTDPDAHEHAALDADPDTWAPDPDLFSTSEDLIG